MSQAPQQRDDKGGGAPPKTDAAPAKKAPRLRDKKITVTLTLPQTIFGGLFSLFILIWVFIFGVMLGRGHNPEEVVPPLAEMMPSKKAPVVILDEDSLDEVLQPRDLKYHDTLKSKEPMEKPRTAPQQAARTQPARQPGQQQSQQTAKPQPAAKPQQAQPKPAAPAQKGDKDQTVYNYVYQVAAVNNSAGAQSLQKKLQGSGLSASVLKSESSGKTWYRVMVAYKGRPEDTNILREKLATHGIPAIILREKTPAK
jgi:Cell division protein